MRRSLATALLLTCRTRNIDPDGVGSAPYSSDYNVGDTTLFTGGSTAFHLLLPVILNV